MFLVEVKTKNETLQCPADSKRRDVGAGYQTLSNNIVKFSELGNIPLQINLASLDEGDGIETTFLRRKARWHKNCHSLFNASKLERVRKRVSLEEETNEASNHKYTRSSTSSQASQSAERTEDLCFLCDKRADGDKNQLHNVRTLTLDTRVRKCANILQDQKLIAKLSAGDLVAQEASYHSSCLLSLYKTAGNIEQNVEGYESNRQMDGIVLAELLAFLEDSRANVEGVKVFRLADLANMYTSWMEQLGADMAGHLHTTRLKERILAHLPELESYIQGRDIWLSFKDVALVLEKAYREDSDDEAIHLSKTARIIRRDMLQLKEIFSGSFERNCQ